MKVLKKQVNSKMCIICGMDNPAGLKAFFYEMEDHSVISPFKYSQIHQSYPERAHGGLISTMLDEIIGRAIWIDEPDVWGVTMDLHVKFRKPVPLDTLLFARGIITKNSKRFFSGAGEITDIDGNILAEGIANYIKIPVSKLASTDVHDDVNVMVSDDVTEIDYKINKKD